MNDYVKMFGDFLQSLYGMPGYLLALVSGIAFGYCLKFLTWYPNRFIPTGVIVWSIALNLLLAPTRPNGEPIKFWLARHFAVGMIIGVLSWIVHNKFLKRFEDRIPILRGLGVSDASDDTPQPPVGKP